MLASIAALRGCGRLSSISPDRSGWQESILPQMAIRSFQSNSENVLWQRRLKHAHEIINHQVKGHLMTMHSFSSFNQAQAIADKYAIATRRTMYVVYEAHEFYVATEEDLSTIFIGLSENQVRYCTAEKTG